MVPGQGGNSRGGRRIKLLGILRRELQDFAGLGWLVAIGPETSHKGADPAVSSEGHKCIRIGGFLNSGSEAKGKGPIN